MIDTSRPLTGAKPSRAKANELTTADAAVTLTWKLLANVGRAGATRAYPNAITKLAATITHTSRGSRAVAADRAAAIPVDAIARAPPPPESTAGWRTAFLGRVPHM